MSTYELLDAVDENGKVIGQYPRSVFHNNPERMHPVVHCWIFNNKGQVLMQQRSLLKDFGAGLWDMSCGGHIKAGDNAHDTLIRELEEELHLINVIPIFVKKYIYKNERQCELINLYFVRLDEAEYDFIIQKEEVEQVEWLDIDKAILESKSGKRQSTNSIYEQLPMIMQFLISKS